MMESKSRGQIGYEAYATSTGGKTFDGRDMPTWLDLPERIQAAWEAAAIAIVEAARPPVGWSGQARPTPGRIVHYVLPREGRDPVVRPAIVVHKWPDHQGTAQVIEGTLQLQIFTDGSNDGRGCETGLLWATSVKHDEETKAPGTWHWPARA